MQFAIPPNVLAANLQSGAPITLQPGDIINALVLNLLDDGKVRIAVANKIIELASQLPLVPGTNVQLAVKGSPTGLVLAPVDTDRQGAGTTGAVVPPDSTAAPPTATGSAVAATRLPQTPAASADMVEPPPADSHGVPPASAALSQAVRSAAARQNGLAPLFADVAEVATAASLPKPVQEAMARLLGFRLSTSAPVTAAEVKQAFSRSGLFLEARLAAEAGSSGPAQAAPEDLKAALVVFRQVLKTWLGALPAAKPEFVPPAIQPSPDSYSLAPYSARQPNMAADPEVPAGAGGETIAANATADADEATITADPRMPRGLARMEPGQPEEPGQPGQPEEPGQSGQPEEPGQPGQRGPAAQLAARAATTLDKMSLLTALEETTARGGVLSTPEQSASPAAVRTQSTASKTDVAPEARPLEAPGRPTAPPLEAPGRPTAPPPPYRGAPMAAQPPVSASTTAGADPHVIGKRLLDDTDAALSRQTLLQAVSLPDGARASPEPSQRDTAAMRWTFEIPFATPQGTAIAQFEIARDGRGAAAENARPAWRARFSLDVEPIGPVHVQIALSGARAAVTLWAEREASAARLREDAPLLVQALSRAELEPGDVLVRNGEPPRPAEAGAGLFLDRAS